MLLKNYGKLWVTRICTLNQFNQNQIELDTENQNPDIQTVQHTQNIKTGDSYMMIFTYLLLLSVVIICQGVFSFGRKFVPICGNSYVYICVG